MNKVLNVVKYQNRKLYAPELHRYITMEEIQSKINEGFDIRVTCYKTKNDLTPSVLARLIYESAMKELGTFKKSGKKVG